MVGGMFLPVRELEKRYGRETAKAFYKWSKDSIDYVEALVEEEIIDCDFDRSGEIHLASKPSHFPGMITAYQYLEKEYGRPESKIVQPENLSEEIGSPFYHGGIVEEDSAAIDPAKFVFGLARAAKNDGAQIYEHAEVKRVSKQNGGFRLKTAKGDIKAREVLIATNGYTTSMLPKIRFGVFPGACYSIVTEPLSQELQKEISPKGRTFHDSRYYINYFRVLADGRVLLGGRNTLVQGHDLNRSAAELRTRLLLIFPQLKDVEITHSWTGTLGFTFDRMPHFGQMDGIYYAYGFMGHGVAIASHMGFEAGQIITGKRESNLFMEIKHPRYFFSVFDRIFFPFVCAWYRTLDRIR